MSVTTALQLCQRANLTRVNLSSRSFLRITSCRALSNSNNNNLPPPLILYQRDTANRSLRPRAMLTLASLHTVYWTWYVVDFIPAVNNVSTPDLSIHPSVGLVGLLVAATINAGVGWYGTRLVSEVAVRDDMVWIRTHSLPFLRPSKVSKRHAVGTLTMDEQSVETKRVMDAGTFDEAMGHLLVKNELAPRSPYLLDIQNDEVQDEHELMRVLLLTLDSEEELEDDEDEQKRNGRRRVKLNLSSRQVPAMKARREASVQRRVR